uniref:Enkurin domain-containing protein n=1 Tax=Octactis speculum TaxID=3111310 RepID=A0A7S2AZP1_9STRA|mmetsp:Transcript_17707/g.23911  ORF Transcript_17707/g.23911 Transcript_17707/m.23911 type:complete len:258 (+) Transcript_17707:70-843(+)|eukprot:CAMPEP_0185769152 /NCGR_PEP_ID=MMETSP1174-20130828/53402_1 /TAXON_ID=35687 /ORGANISM="Dictyocha speculum, Strain CCMP1381" /LENGTH=257 /DNA_ID=CAMNT_0028454121 /DNA_START=70 /DNA_END=846 /DNA_ORIENTATION=-
MAANECIFNLVPQELKAIEKSPMYRSKHDPRAPVTNSTLGVKGTTRLHGVGTIVKKNSGTMGRPDRTSAANPNTFLKKKTGPVYEAGGNFMRETSGRKSAVPKKHERPILGQRSAKNFISVNAVEAILKVPGGRKEEDPRYMTKSDFGKKPAYLKQVKEQIQRENELIDQYMENQAGRNRSEAEEELEMMDPHEQEELIIQLKTKWDSVNQSYQKMCHMVTFDTVGKLRRKTELEAELTNLDADIQRLSKGPVYLSK